MPFDVKYIALRGQVFHQQDYRHSASYSGEQPAELIVIAFENVADHLAILPYQAWKRARGAVHGVEPLINGIPAWFQPFMVSLPDLRDAYNSIADAVVAGTAYRNPTTGIELEGFRVNGSRSSAVTSITGSPTSNSSNEAYLRLWALIEDAGGRVQPNPLAPLFFDFLMSLPDIGTLRVEHKYDGGGAGGALLGPGARSPWKRRRIWHVLWMDSDKGILCVMRDEVGDDWGDHLDFSDPFPPGFRSDHTFATFPEALQHIRQHADAARQKAASVLANVQPHEISVDMLAAKSRRIKRLIAEIKFSERARITVPTTLPSLCPQLNEISRHQGYGIVLPLDPFHPLATHVFVAHSWTDDQKQQYDDFGGKLPLHVYSRELCRGDVRCILLRLQNHTMEASRMMASPQSFPLIFKAIHWRKPAPFKTAVSPYPMIIGSLMDGGDTTAGGGPWCCYFALPAEFIVSYACGQNMQLPDPALKVEARHLFDYTAEQSPAIFAERRQTGVARLDHPLVLEGVNVARYVLSVQDHSLWRELRRVLDASGPVSIVNRQSTSANKSFDATSYHTTLRHVHQAAWDYGCEPSRDEGVSTVANHDHRRSPQTAKTRGSQIPPEGAPPAQAPT